jgi:hypothetical protein
MRRAILVLLLAAALTACGKKGAPSPPLPRGPLAPRSVAARQLGAQVLVAFEVPAARGEHPSQEPVEAELVRVVYAPGLAAPPDPDVFRRRGTVVGSLGGAPLEPGSRAWLEDDRLAEIDDRGRGWTLRYGVRVRDRRGRPSPLVVAPDLVPVEAASPPRDIAGEPTADGIRLSWSPPAPEEAAATSYSVYRAVRDGPWPEFPLNPEPIVGTSYLDTTVVAGQRYRYTVRVAHASDAPFREGETSAPLVVDAEDRFAPSAPRGLVAVQEGRAVRLFWNPSPERDVAGYRVQRRVDGGPWESVGADPLVQPSCLDASVETGQRLTYRVTAVDRISPPNESPPSTEVELEVLAEPVAPGPAS